MGCHSDIPRMGVVCLGGSMVLDCDKVLRRLLSCPVDNLYTPGDKPIYRALLPD